MTAPRIKFSVVDKVARITLANPAGRNAMDLQFCQEFGKAAIACETDPSIKVILIEAEGDVFSVGGDITEFVANKDRVHPHVLDMATQIHIGVAGLRRAAAPVIAAVNGMTAGGAFSMVAGADVVIAKRSAKFNAAFTKSGLTPDAGGTYFFPRVAGFRKAFWIMATNPTLTADQAAEIDLVTQVVDDEKFAEEVERIVRQFADSVPGALSGLKSLFRSSLTNTLDDQLNLEARSIAARCADPATLELLVAFLNKKK
ncbi:MAG: enoyl-CoA hydratase/carnithine racemase [Rhodospirillales bacterium]|nr:enoyl-CoA hydratase/carnithine racemase [Rhodospirillales bacterium]